MDYTVLGVSSGIGVSLFPFKEHCIGNIEPRAIFHTPKNEQWKANFGHIPIYRNLSEIASIKPNVIISSPDCGSGSVLRYSRAKKLGNHGKNSSLLMFFKGLKKWKPDFFYLENLPTLFKSLPQKKWNQVKSMYSLVQHVAPVSHWGNSQVNRKRLIIVGIRSDLAGKWDKIFRLPDLRDNIKTCRELYGDLDDQENIAFGHISEPLNEDIAMYGGCKMNLADIAREWKKRKGDKRWTVYDRKYKNAPGVYRNLKNDYPATARKSNRQFDHNGFMLTPRQIARIQGVPDGFRIFMKRKRLNYWINKARAAVTKCPPYEISVWFKGKLDKYYGNR